MKNFILITAILEITAGLGMALAPQLIPDLASADALALCLAKMYGGAALAVGIFSLLVYRNMNNQELVRTCLILLAIFHAGVAAAGIQGFMGGEFEKPSIAILHGIFALVTLYFYFKNK